MLGDVKCYVSTVMELISRCILFNEWADEGMSGRVDYLNEWVELQQLYYS